MADGVVTRVLYRALWRWARAPVVRDAQFLIALKDPRMRALAGTDALTDGAGVLAAIRHGFRSDAVPPDVRLDAGFDALKATTDAQTTLELLWARRERSQDREGVAFRVGDVLRHGKYGYRCVVVGWDNRADAALGVEKWEGVRETARLQDQPFYHVLPDKRDVVKALGHYRDTRYVAEDNLSRLGLDEPKGVAHRALSSLFDVDAPRNAAGALVPFKQLAFQFPRDVSAPAAPSDDEGAAENAAAQGRVLSAVADCVERLADLFSSERFGKVAKGPRSIVADVLGVLGVLQESPKMAYDACSQLGRAHMLFENLLETRNSHRRECAETAALPLLGSFVKHSKFGYRGVVVGWDRRPLVDVRNWDGVKGTLKEAMQPFLHVVADDDDSTSIFGAPRGFRYCAAENIVPLAETEAAPRSTELARYLRPDDDGAEVDAKGDAALSDAGGALTCYTVDHRLAFQYPDEAPGDAPDAGVADLEAALQGARRELRSVFVAARRRWTDGSVLEGVLEGAGGGEVVEADAGPGALAVDDLLLLLRRSSTLDDAQVVDRILALSSSATLCADEALLLASAEAAADRGEVDVALKLLIAQPRPHRWAEPWRRAAALSLGEAQLENACVFARAALDCDDRQINARATLGRALARLGDPEAVSHLARVAAAHPFTDAAHDLFVATRASAAKTDEAKVAPRRSELPAPL
ncbi:hypothetical protein M885DRAFT_610685 [Pelagophyceae sp. CCMP2097]|nr:hypothetical protein M885DRAFT_610685 [Pelagophyceae sp. CCMP2097]